MSQEPTFADMVLSQVGSPKDYTAEWVAIGIVLLAVVAYVGLEYGLGRLLSRLMRTVAAKWRDRKNRR